MNQENLREYLKQLKDINNQLSSIDVLKRRDGIELMFKKEMIANPKGFLIELSFLKSEVEKIQEAITWIEENTRSRNSEDY